MAKIFEAADSQVTSNVHTLFSRILEQTLALANHVRDLKSVSRACDDTLRSLLGTLSLVDFFDTIEILLRRPNDDLRRQVLRVLEGRLEQNRERDTPSQKRALDFLSTLIGILEASPDILLKHAAVACIEKISERYGRKDHLKVVAAAKVVCSEHCLGQADDRIRIIGVLCLASMAELLGQAIIPVLPDALSRSFSLLRSSMKLGKKSPRLHDAVYSLISVLLIHVPWMISGDDFDHILQLSFESANANIPEESRENRRETLQLLAKQVDVKETFGAIERNWSFAVSEGPKVSYGVHPFQKRIYTLTLVQAANEALEVIGVAIEKHPKSSTLKNVSVLGCLLRKAFDLRRIQFCPRRDESYEEREVDDVENSANSVAIKMIYKLNDTTFRPFFIELTEWATTGLPKDGEGRMMRLTTFYKFIAIFFDTLKVNIILFH